jgi:hypothetical protein
MLENRLRRASIRSLVRRMPRRLRLRKSRILGLT